MHLESEFPKKSLVHFSDFNAHFFNDHVVSSIYVFDINMFIKYDNLHNIILKYTTANTNYRYTSRFIFHFFRSVSTNGLNYCYCDSQSKSNKRRLLYSNI